MTEIVILLFLIILNGLFVMSEIALVSARKSRLENQADKGDIPSRIALDLTNNPQIFLSAAQIGITLISILTGVYSGERFGQYLKPALEKIAFIKPYAGTISTTIVVIIVTLLT
ncbi:MAG TPA: CNNM domain-containing protein, partial [Chitinophagaceae bacterium]|nr:CNNM domain-containing protein [Chitinophagaceae bacterium]